MGHPPMMRLGAGGGPWMPFGAGPSSGGGNMVGAWPTTSVKEALKGLETEFDIMDLLLGQLVSAVSVRGTPAAGMDTLSISEMFDRGYTSLNRMRGFRVALILKLFGGNSSSSASTSAQSAPPADAGAAAGTKGPHQQK